MTPSAKKTPLRIKAIEQLLEMKELKIVDGRTPITYRELTHLIRNAKLPEFEGLTEKGLYSCVIRTFNELQSSIRHSRRAPMSLDEKTKITSYIEETETLLEEVKKRLEYLKELLVNQGW